MDVVEHDILMSAKRAKKKLSKIIDLVNSDIRKGFLGVVLNVRKRKILALKLLRHCKLRQLFVPVLESKYVLLDIFCGLLCTVNELPRTNLARQGLKLEKFVRCAQILQKKPQLISDLYCLQAEVRKLTIRKLREELAIKFNDVQRRLNRSTGGRKKK